MLGEEDPRPTRRLPGELDGCFDRLRARVAEEHPVDVVPAACYELLRQQPGQERAVHLDHVGKVKVDGLVKCRFDCRVAAPKCVDTKPGEEVEVPMALCVEEVATFSSQIEAVKPDGFKRPCQLGVEVFVVESEVLAMTRTQQLRHIERHTSPTTRKETQHKIVAGAPTYGAVGFSVH